MSLIQTFFTYFYNANYSTVKYKWVVFFCQLVYNYDDNFKNQNHERGLYMDVYR